MQSRQSKSAPTETKPSKLEIRAGSAQTGRVPNWVETGEDEAKGTYSPEHTE